MFFTTTRRRTRRMLTIIYMTRIQNMSFFHLKVNICSICHLVWPRLAPSVWTPWGTPSGPRLALRLAPVGHPVQAPVVLRPRRRLEIKKKKFFKNLFGCCCWLEKRGKNISVFGFQSPRSPSSASFASEVARRRRFFRPSSPSHPSKLYSSLGWLSSKVPKAFFPFTLRLIDVDGF
jgi:hypothetical protein